MITLQVKNLFKKYRVGETIISAVNDISFSVQQGEYIGLVGESGSGKSSLLQILGTLDTPTSGEILINNKNPFNGSDKEISLFRNKNLGFVFQQFHLLPEFTALENIIIPGLISNKSHHEATKEAEKLMLKVGIEHRKNHYPSQLSGGEQQRVAIARALINNPQLILADEPTGNLDSKNAKDIHELFLEIHKTIKTTILVVTHNKDFAATLPRQICLRDGQILSDTHF